MRLRLKLSITIKVGYMKHLKNIHPGEILLEEFLKPMQISAYHLSKDTVIPQTRISAIIKGTRSVTADTALSLPSILELQQNSGWVFRTTLI